MRITVLGLALLLLSGCSASGDDGPAFDAARYRGGDCAPSSQIVFAIESAVNEVVDGDVDPEDATQELRAEQDKLIAAIPAIGDPGLRDPAQKVVDAVGFYRIGLDAKNYTPKLAKAVATRSRQFLSMCSVS